MMISAVTLGVVILSVVIAIVLTIVFTRVVDVGSNGPLSHSFENLAQEVPGQRVSLANYTSSEELYDFGDGDSYFGSKVAVDRVSDTVLVLTQTPRQVRVYDRSTGGTIRNFRSVPFGDRISDMSWPQSTYSGLGVTGDGDTIGMYNGPRIITLDRLDVREISTRLDYTGDSDIILMKLSWDDTVVWWLHADGTLMKCPVDGSTTPIVFGVGVSSFGLSSNHIILMYHDLTVQEFLHNGEDLTLVFKVIEPVRELLVSKDGIRMIMVRAGSIHAMHRHSVEAPWLYTSREPITIDTGVNDVVLFENSHLFISTNQQIHVYSIDATTGELTNTSTFITSPHTALSISVSRELDLNSNLLLVAGCPSPDGIIDSIIRVISIGISKTTADVGTAALPIILENESVYTVIPCSNPTVIPINTQHIYHTIDKWGMSVRLSIDGSKAMTHTRGGVNGSQDICIVNENGDRNYYRFDTGGTCVVGYVLEIKPETYLCVKCIRLDTVPAQYWLKFKTGFVTTVQAYNAGISFGIPVGVDWITTIGVYIWCASSAGLAVIRVDDVTNPTITQVIHTRPVVFARSIGIHFIYTIEDDGQVHTYQTVGKYDNRIVERSRFSTTESSASAVSISDDMLRAVVLRSDNIREYFSRSTIYGIFSYVSEAQHPPPDNLYTQQYILSDEAYYRNNISFSGQSLTSERDETTPPETYVLQGHRLVSTINSEHVSFYDVSC